MSNRNIPALVRHLRETELPQTTGHTAKLRRDNATVCFCALGVVGKEAGLLDVTIDRLPWDEHYAYIDIHVPGKREEYVGYDDIADHFGLTEDERRQIIHWNDVKGLSFREIAGKIEAEFPA